MSSSAALYRIGLRRHWKFRNPTDMESHHSVSVSIGIKITFFYFLHSNLSKKNWQQKQVPSSLWGKKKPLFWWHRTQLNEFVVKLSPPPKSTNQPTRKALLYHFILFYYAIQRKHLTYSARSSYAASIHVAYYSLCLPMPWPAWPPP